MSFSKLTFLFIFNFKIASYHKSKISGLGKFKAYITIVNITEVIITFLNLFSNQRLKVKVPRTTCEWCDKLLPQQANKEKNHDQGRVVTQVRNKGEYFKVSLILNEFYMT